MYVFLKLFFTLHLWFLVLIWGVICNTEILLSFIYIKINSLGQMLNIE